MSKFGLKTQNKILLLIILVCLSSKYPLMSNPQTARIMKKGNVGITVSYGNLIASKRCYSEFGELNIRFGISEKWDFGIEIALFMPITFNAKYQFVGNDSSLIACSAAIGLGTTSLEEFILHDDDKYIAVFLPLYASIHPSNWFGLYINPRIYSFFWEGKPLYNVRIASGVRIGKKIAFLLEYLINTDHEYDNEISSQFIVALTYNIP